METTIFAFLLCITVGNAYTFSTPNCTLLAEELHHFVAAPQIRGTLDILWTCLATIFACTYTVLHLNLPEQRDGRDFDRGWMGDLKWWWKGVSPSFKWMVVTLLAPEYYTALAIGDHDVAKKFLRELKALPASQRPAQGWTFSYSFFIRMGGFAIRSKSDSLDRRPPLIHLKSKTILALLRERANNPDQASSSLDFSLPTEADILDRSKSDMFVKTITALQVLYLCASCLTRFGRRLPTTLLELGTLGFAACSICSYVVLLRMPRGVNNAIVLMYWEQGLSPAAALVIEKNGHQTRVSNIDDVDSKAAAYCGIALAIALGGIHLAGWNFVFPTLIDRWLWRSCSIASIAAPIIISIIFYWTIEDRFSWLWFSMVFIYSITRSILIAEMFRCLFYLPTEAYTTTWTINIPHVG